MCQRSHRQESRGADQCRRQGSGDFRHCDPRSFGGLEDETLDLKSNKVAVREPVENVKRAVTQLLERTLEEQRHSFKVEVREAIAQRVLQWQDWRQHRETARHDGRSNRVHRQQQQGKGVTGIGTRHQVGQGSDVIEEDTITGARRAGFTNNWASISIGIRKDVEGHGRGIGV